MFAELHARVGDVRPHGGLGAAQVRRDLIGRHVFHIAEQQGRPLAAGEDVQGGFQMLAPFRPQQQLLRTVVRGDRHCLGHFFEFGKLTRPLRRKKSIAVLLAIRDNQRVALSRSLS